MPLLGDALEAAPGVRVWVRAKNGLTMEVVYVTLDRPWAVAMKMTRGPLFFEKFAGSWLFEPLAPARVAVRFRYTFETRWPRLRPALNRAIALVFERDVRLRLRGLKRAAEETSILGDLRRTPRA